MNQERMSQFLNRVHDPFSWRSKPKEFWNDLYGERAEYYTDNFRFVKPREFSFDIFESRPHYGEGDALCVMTVETFLYYLPSFMSLVVQDIDRSTDLRIAILGNLRSYPPGYQSNIKSWVKHAQEQDSFDGPLQQCWTNVSGLHIRTLRKWFLLNVNRGQNERIVQMTKTESETVREFLDISERLEADVLGMAPYPAWTHSVRSILLDLSLSNRLGAKNEGDILDLIRLIDLAVQKYPQCFPKQAAQSIKDQLIAEMA